MKNALMYLLIGCCIAFSQENWKSAQVLYSGTPPVSNQKQVTGRTSPTLSRNVLYSQIPDTLTASGYRCQLDTIFPDEADLADDIMPTGNGWQIDSIVAWFTTWGPFHTWDSVPNIHFLVYQDSGTQPADSPMTEIVIGQSNYAAYEINPPNPDRWRVELALPSPVVLDTFRYWIEIQPYCEIFTSGYTGNQGEVGIGNGQDFFFRYPNIAIPSWQSATQVFGEPLESGFMLLGTEVGISENTKTTAEGNDVSVTPTITFEGATVTLTLCSPASIGICIYNAVGQKVRSVFANRFLSGKNRFDISLHNLAAGVYFIEIDLGSDSVVKKVIKNR